MDKYQRIFFEIKKRIKYIMNDNHIILSNKYFLCLSEIFTVLQKTLNKIEGIYYKYILYPQLCNL